MFEPDAVGANGFVVVLRIMKCIDAATHAQDAGLLFFEVGLVVFAQGLADGD